MVCEETSSGVKLGILKLTSGVLDEIREGQKSDLCLVDRLALINQGRGGDFRIDENGILKCRDRVCVPNVGDLKKRILDEWHRSGLSIHTRATKMYQDFKKLFWWSGIIVPQNFPSHSHTRHTPRGSQLLRLTNN